MNKWGGVASLCNQVLPAFSSNQFEMLHRCYKHIEHVLKTFCRRKIILTKLRHFGFRQFCEVMLQYGVESLCTQLLSGFSIFKQSV